jgi:hypothetical protein
LFSMTQGPAIKTNGLLPPILTDPADSILLIGLPALAAP